MAHPLSPLSASGQNVRCPATIARTNNYKSLTTIESRSYTMDHNHENAIHEDDTLPPSSPFVEDVDLTLRSPGKPRNPSKQPSPKKPSPECIPLTENALRENEGLTRVIQELHGTKNQVFSEAGHETMSMAGGAKNYIGADDSTFSVIPMLPRNNRSPTRSEASSPSKNSRYRDSDRSPHRSRPTTPGTARRRDYDDDIPSSPTPRRAHPTDSDDTTNLLLEFTGQLPSYSQPSNRSPTRASRPSPSKSQRQPDVSGYAASHGQRSPTRERLQPASPSEARHLTNLLDFDLPPAPTPRSVPTITPRELENLKSSYLSQISSLRATLSGKEAEITSLKEAKDNAERRVGDVLDESFEHQNAKEQLQTEKLDWERRDKEMQKVLHDIRAEILLGERERQDLATKTKDLEKRCEEADLRAAEAESKVAGLEAGTATVTPAPGTSRDVSTPGSGTTNKAVEVAVEKVARELHTLYKAKHETKVSALKKSYEARWEKRIRELQTKVEDVTKENEELKLGRDATMSGVVPSSHKPEASEEEKARQDVQAKKLESLETDLAVLATEMETVRNDNALLRSDLETSRKENSELVTAVSEMLLLESSMPPATMAQPLPAPSNENFKASLSRPPMLKASTGPGRGLGGLGESRIGMMKPRTTSGNVVGQGLRSGIMSNIERMGRGRAME